MKHITKISIIVMIFIVANLFFFWMHEYTHYNIFLMYGCQADVALMHTFSPDCNPTGDLLLAQATVESVTYMLFTVYNAVLVLISMNIWRKK